MSDYGSVLGRDRMEQSARCGCAFYRRLVTAGCLRIGRNKHAKGEGSWGGDGCSKASFVDGFRALFSYQPKREPETSRCRRFAWWSLRLPQPRRKVTTPMRDSM